jgi:hypothetical protein
VGNLREVWPAIENLHLACVAVPAAATVRPALEKLLLLARVMVAQHLVEQRAVGSRVRISAYQRVAVAGEVLVAEALRLLLR